MTGYCNGICLTASDIGLPGNQVAYPHPTCPEHGLDPDHPFEHESTDGHGHELCRCGGVRETHKGEERCPHERVVNKSCYDCGLKFEKLLDLSYVPHAWEFLGVVGEQSGASLPPVDDGEGIRPGRSDGPYGAQLERMLEAGDDLPQWAFLTDVELAELGDDVPAEATARAYVTSGCEGVPAGSTVLLVDRSDPLSGRAEQLVYVSRP